MQHTFTPVSLAWFWPPLKRRFSPLDWAFRVGLSEFTRVTDRKLTMSFKWASLALLNGQYPVKLRMFALDRCQSTVDQRW